MTRYLFGVFPEIYDFHFNLVSDPRNELKMEVWNSDFDRNLNVILDRLNLIDSTENQEILRRSGLSDVDVLRERKRLYDLMKTQDVSQIEVSVDNGIGHIAENKETESRWGQTSRDRFSDLRLRMGHRFKRQSRDGTAPSHRHLEEEDESEEEGRTIQFKHVHTARNDTEYIEALLGFDDQICLLLKHVTELISYGWLYPEYC